MLKALYFLMQIKLRSNSQAAGGPFERHFRLGLLSGPTTYLWYLNLMTVEGMYRNGLWGLGRKRKLLPFVAAFHTHFYEPLRRGDQIRARCELVHCSEQWFLMQVTLTRGETEMLRAISRVGFYSKDRGMESPASMLAELGLPVPASTSPVIVKLTAFGDALARQEESARQISPPAP